MKIKTVWWTWLYLFGLCCVLGFIPEPTGFIQVLLGIVGICFFIPPAFLLIKGDEKSVFWVRLLSILSLVLTTVTVILNFASALMDPVWGTVFQIIMAILSTPMLCCQIWVISLFGWACLMSASFFIKK